jgi:hypothetical protein
LAGCWGGVSPVALPAEPWSGFAGQAKGAPDLWAVPRDVVTRFHAAMGISVALRLVPVALCPCRFS